MKTKLVPLLILFVPGFFLSSCKSKPDDAAIQTEVNKNIANAAITANVTEGVVTLTGTCPDGNCKTSAEAAAKNTKDVKSVVDNITVDVPAPQTAPVVISNDDALKSSVDSILKSYKNVSADISDGVVTLRGSVERAKLQDLIIALNGIHPKKVDNQLVIK